MSLCAGSELAVEQEVLKYAVCMCSGGGGAENERNRAITFLSHVKSVIITVI